MFTCFCLKGVIKTKFLSKLKIVHYFWHRIMRESLKAKQNYSSMFDKDYESGISLTCLDFPLKESFPLELFIPTPL